MIAVTSTGTLLYEIFFFKLYYLISLLGDSFNQLQLFLGFLDKAFGGI